MPELWELYDGDKRPTGKTMLRGQIVPEGYWHIVVGIWTITADGRLLLTCRHPDKPWGLQWENTGGSVHFETSNPAVATIDDDGVVIGVAAGTVTITATCFNGKKATATLTIGTTSVELPTSEYASTESQVTSYREGMSNAEKLEYVIYCAQTQRGKPYKSGGGYSQEDNPAGFDCSGLVYWSFLHINVKVQASAYRQGYDDSQPKIGMGDLRRGDIVCFNTNENDSDQSDHTGIYLGNGKFIHASSSAKKVVESTLAAGYYNRTFSWGRRVLP